MIKTTKKGPNMNNSVDNSNNPSNYFFDLANNLLCALPKRSQEIIKKRYGLLDGKKATLEKIGKDYGITRERVRQIIFDALDKISGKKDDINFKKAEDKIIFTISENGGIIRESDILKQLGNGDEKESSAVAFFAECIAKILIIENNKSLRKSWALSESVAELAAETGALAEEILKKENKALNNEKISQKIIFKNSNLSSGQVLNFLRTLSQIEKNKFDKWGIADWSEINPKGTRERVHLILKEKGKPLHFKEIAKFIDEYKLSKRNSHPQTVHNELIKDNRFVLIGRGIYALREWGYSEGTVKDVLENILGKSNRALDKEEIIREVCKIRQVKKTTILINLSNNKVFAKHNNLYSVKK